MERIQYFLEWFMLWLLKMAKSFRCFVWFGDSLCWSDIPIQGVPRCYIFYDVFERRHQRSQLNCYRWDEAKAAAAAVADASADERAAAAPAAGEGEGDPHFVGVNYSVTLIRRWMKMETGWISKRLIVIEVQPVWWSSARPSLWPSGGSFLATELVQFVLLIATW